MRALWNGNLSFGLVNIPIELYTAVQSQTMDFDILHEKCKTKLQYQRWCPTCKKVVPWQDVVKGLKVDHSYAVFSQADLKKLMPETTAAITIFECVDQKSISPIYFDHHYYAAPGKSKNEHPFMLFVSALQSMNKIAIGAGVLRNKEYVFAIQPYQDILLITTLNYEYEIRDAKSLAPAKKSAISAKEVTLAKELLMRLYAKKFDMSVYKDTFKQKIEKALRAKKTTKVKQPTRKKAATTPETKTTRANLLEQLRQSMKQPSSLQAKKRTRTVKKTSKAKK